MTFALLSAGGLTIEHPRCLPNGPLALSVLAQRLPLPHAYIDPLRTHGFPSFDLILSLSHTPID